MIKPCGRCGAPAELVSAEELFFVRNVDPDGCVQRCLAVEHIETWGTYTDGMCCGSIKKKLQAAVDDWNATHGRGWTVAGVAR